MTVINVEIPEQLDERFRQKVFERKGLRKGNLTDALVEAIELWIEKDAISTLASAILSNRNITTVQLKAAKTLRRFGRAAIPALSHVASQSFLPSSVQEEALKAIDEILEGEK